MYKILNYNGRDLFLNKKSKHNDKEIKNYFTRQNIRTFLFWLMLVLLALFNALNKSGYINFSPVYLGMGHLVLGSLFTFIFGNNFHSSYCAMRFLTFICFAITLYVISRVISKDKRLAQGITLSLCAVDVMHFKNIEAILGDIITKALSITTTSGNSARFIRSSICVITPILIPVIYKFLQWANGKIKSRKIDIYILGCVAVGFSAAFAIFYSNDYGIASAFSVLLMSALTCFKLCSKNIKKLFISGSVMLASFFLSVFILAAIVTGLHPLAYFRSTLGVSSYQPWYAVHSPVICCYFLWDVPIQYPYAYFAIFLVVIYAFIYFRGEINKERYFRYAVPCIILFTGYTAVHMYRIGDGGGVEYFVVLLLATSICEVVTFASKHLRPIIENAASAKNSTPPQFIISLLPFIICASVLLAQIQTFVVDSLNGKYKNGVEVEELGGNMLTLGDSVNKTKERMRGKKIFSTYASAVEAAIDTFQPTGIDYIIHALGDDKREHYLNVFHNDAPDYVCITNENFDVWEGCIRGLNWFFYRDFLDSYVLDLCNEYQLYYSKAAEPQRQNIPCDVSVVSTDTGTTVINVKYDKQFTGIADVKLTYDVKKTDDPKNNFRIKNLIFLKDMYNAEKSFNKDFPLPGGGGKTQTFYIPIQVVNGVGKMTVTSYPLDYTILTVNSAQVEGFFQNTLNFAAVTKCEQSGNKATIYVKTADVSKLNKVYKIQHKNKFANVISTRPVGEDKAELVIDDPELADELDDMSAIKLITR